MKIRPDAPADEPRHPDRSAASDPSVEPDRPAEPIADGTLAARVDLAGLSIAGITRRRVGWVAAGLIAVWIVIVFARQVGDAANAATRAVQLAEDNAALAAEVQALQSEVDLIVRPEFVRIQARAYGLGGSHEIPFTLDPSIPAPVDGAPGSSSVRLGARPERSSPLDSWLSMLFGPGG